MTVRADRICLCSCCVEVLLFVQTNSNLFPFEADTLRYRKLSIHYLFSYCSSFSVPTTRQESVLPTDCLIIVIANFLNIKWTLWQISQIFTHFLSSKAKQCHPLLSFCLEIVRIFLPYWFNGITSVQSRKSCFTFLHSKWQTDADGHCFAWT